MANEHLVCEFCSEEFSALDAYQQHKDRIHGPAEAAQQRQLDQESKDSFPASDTPGVTNPTVRLGCADGPSTAHR